MRPPSNLYIPDIENYNFEAGKGINYGFNKAVVEVIPIQVNLDAFNYVLADDDYKKIDNQLNTGQTFEFQHPFDSTILKLNVTSGTWPLKVKACNAAGCSPLSTAKNAHYVSYCM